MTTADPSIAAPPVAPPKERHPASLYLLFATEMWERFGFYTIAAVLTLYLQRGGFGWTRAQSTTLWSYYMMCVYATPVLGGLLADFVLGSRRSVLLGGALFISGYILLGLGIEPLLYVALGLLCLGNGFFKPNISTMVGNLYPAGSKLKDSAYNIFYMGINIGAWLAPVVAEILLQTFAGSDVLAAAKKGAEGLTPEQAAALRTGFLAAFYAAAVGMTIGTVFFLVVYRKLAAADRSHPPTVADMAVAEDIPPIESHAIDKVPALVRVGALVVIYAIVVVFWMVFHQNGTTMTYWADENTNWNVSGVISNSINPFWIVSLSLPLVAFWGWMRSKGLEPSTPAKMAIGMLLTSLAFLVLYIAAKSGGDQTFLLDDLGRRIPAENGDGFQAIQNKVSPVWLIVAYMIISLGELMLSPMGLSLVSKVAPAKIRGLMMGGWFVATAIGNKLTAIGVFWTKWYHSEFWLLCCLSALGMAIVLILLLRPLKRAMPGV